MDRSTFHSKHIINPVWWFSFLSFLSWHLLKSLLSLRNCYQPEDPSLKTERNESSPQCSLHRGGFPSNLRGFILIFFFWGISWRPYTDNLFGICSQNFHMRYSSSIYTKFSEATQGHCCSVQISWSAKPRRIKLKFSFPNLIFGFTKLTLYRR